MFKDLDTRALEIENHGRPLLVDEERSLAFRSHPGVEVGYLVAQNILLFEYFVPFSGGPVSTS